MLTMPIIAAIAAGFSLDGSARAEARGGPTVGGQDPSSAAISADLFGRASNPEGVLRFGLSPSGVLAQGRQLFVRGFVQGERRLGGSAWARLRQTLGYGSLDLSPVGPGPLPGPLPGPVPGAVQLPPASRFVSVEESNTSFELDVAASRRLRFLAFAAWVVSGGVDAAARQFLPLSRGPQVRAHFDWSATRLDMLRADLEALDYRYSNGRRASVASLTAGWRTRLSRGTELSVALGPGIGRAQAPDQRTTTLAYAVGAADFRATLAPELSASIGASAEPLGDPLSGEIVERGSLRVSAVWERPRVLLLAARLLGSVSLTSGSGNPTSVRAGDLYFQAELSTTVPLTGRSNLAGGVRAALLSRPLPDQPADQWIAFVSYVAQVSLFR
jgi:hypothetical protein